MKSIRSLVQLLVFSFALSALSVSVVHAALVSWALQGVEFVQGGAATGSFHFDADTGIFSSVDIVTATGGIVDHYYSIPHTAGSASTLDFLETGANLADLQGDWRLLLSLSAAMTNSGGVISLSLSPFHLEGMCGTSNCAITIDTRFVARGSIVGSPVSAIPVPAAVWLFITALLGLAGFGRRSRETWH